MKTKFYFLLLFLCVATSIKAQTTIFSEGFDDVPALFTNSVPTTILAEGFDDITTLSADGWNIVNVSDPIGTESWVQGQGYIPAHAGGQSSSIIANYNSTGNFGTISNWLIAPMRSLKNGDVIKFWTSGQATINIPDRLEVRLSTLGSSSITPVGALGVGSYTTLLLEINPSLAVGGYPQTMTEYSLTVSGLTAPTNCHVAFRYFVTNGGVSSVNSNAVAIDTFSITSNTNAWTTLNLSLPLGPTKWFQGIPNNSIFSSHNGIANSYVAANYRNTTEFGGTISNWLILPTQSLQNGDVIKFWTRSVGSSPDRLELRLSETGANYIAPTTAVNTGSYGLLLQEVNPNLVQGAYPLIWTEYSITITGINNNSNYSLAFRYYVTGAGPNVSQNSDYIGIDTLSIVRPALSNPTFDLTSKITLSPNPVNDVFQLNLNESKDVAKLKVEVYDLNGRMIKSFEKATNYSIAELEAGVYLVKVTDGNISETKRIVKR